ncbi:hypothetical protein ACWERI_07450 [Streptomyces collinus]|uniref:hypothetical protein n=1 Tax=Streptomyces collinus TaxID=42684 RepID=UPI003678BAF4
MSSRWSSGRLSGAAAVLVVDPSQVTGAPDGAGPLDVVPPVADGADGAEGAPGGLPAGGAGDRRAGRGTAGSERAADPAP